jgi:ABC-type amino acid transport substrate-binding protein
MQEMGMPYTIKNMPFDTLLPQTQLASVHMVCSGLSVTPERAQHILMSDPYVPQEPVVLIYPAGNTWSPKTMDDLQGKNIIINNGYNTDILIQKYPGIALVRTPGPAEAMLALSFGKGDGFLIGAFAAQELITKQEPGKWAVAPLDVPLAPMVVGISPYYPELLTAVNEAIAKLHASGALTELQRSWRLIS